MTTDDFEQKAKQVVDELETVVKKTLGKNERVRRLKERLTAAVAKAMKAADGLARKIDNLQKDDDEA
jgi:uncharacterized coiled-coil DUF342 family protein